MRTQTCRILQIGCLLGMFTLIMWAVPAQAELYRYVDDEGNVHFVESFNKVPEQYQDQVREISGSKVPSYKGRPPAQREGSGATAAPMINTRGAIGDNDGRTQAYWCGERLRIEQTLEQVSARLEQLQSRGAVSVDQASGLKALYNIQKDISDLKERKADLEHQLDDLSNRVRKAGGNPGWVKGVTCPTDGPVNVNEQQASGPSPEELKSRDYWEGRKADLEAERDKIKQSIARAEAEITGNAGADFDPVVAAHNKMMGEDLARLEGDLIRVERELSDLPNQAAAAGVPRSWVE